MSDRAIAEMCGVSAKTVAAARPKQTAEFPQLPAIPRKGLDGKARKTPAAAKISLADIVCIALLAILRIVSF